MSSRPASETKHEQACHRGNYLGSFPGLCFDCAHETMQAAKGLFCIFMQLHNFFAGQIAETPGQVNKILSFRQ